MKVLRLSLVALVTAIVLGGGLTANAALEVVRTYGFYNITGNSAVNAAIGEAQLSVQIIKDTTDDGVALFKFLNSGPEASSITQIYFEDGALLGSTLSISGSSGVDFIEGAGNKLPGRNGATPPFTSSAAFIAGPTPPRQPNGVNPGEEVTLTFALQSGLNFQEVLDSLDLFEDTGVVQAGTIPGTLRIGFHVQGFGDGGSESFVNNPTPEDPEDPGDPTDVVPEPISMVSWLGLGAIGLGIARLRRRKNKKQA